MVTCRMGEVGVLPGQLPTYIVEPRPFVGREDPGDLGTHEAASSRLARDPGEAGSRELERSGEARAVRGVSVAARDREAVVPARAVRERDIPAHDACGVAAELGDPGLRGRTGPARAERLQVVGELPLLEGRADLGGG